jgi:hypothetical protein
MALAVVAVPRACWAAMVPSATKSVASTARA